MIQDENFDKGYQLHYDKKLGSVKKNFDKFIRVEFLSDDLKSLNFIDLSQPKINEVWTKVILENTYNHEFKYIETDSKKSWYDFYNQNIADLVFMNLEKQFELFGYDRNSWKNGTP